MLEEIHRQQLHPGPLQDELRTASESHLDSGITWAALNTAKFPSLKVTGNTASCSPWELCVHVFETALNSLYCGPELHNIDPNITEAYLQFEATS